MGGMIRFHNTLSGRVEDFVPIEPGQVKLYTCGPTVYDFPHIGNWRAYVFEDLLKRFLVYRGLKVVHVMNITDVDDKTIRGAQAKGVSLDEYTRPFIEAFGRDRDTLNIVPADHYPRATAHIPEMVALVRTLLAKGFAYRKEGSIYFAIDKFPAYGRLSKINLEDRRPGSRGDADEYEKESVHDFALWKAPKDGEPFWETEIGPGRPGWHIECSAMSAKYLGPTFDIHCGGVDNIFPHHENEIAQSEAANGVKFVDYWLHCHHLVVDGQKMAKSKGNFYRLSDVLARGYDPHEVRLLLLSTHYRKMLNFTFEALDQARAGRNRIRDFLVDLRGIKREGPLSDEVAGLTDAARADFIAALEDDLNISEALASLFTLIKNANRLVANGSASMADARNLSGFISEIDEKILGLRPTDIYLTPDPGFQVQTADTATITEDVKIQVDISGAVDADIRKKIDERQAARAAKDFKRADEIRQELLEAGIVLEDTKDGVRWKKVGPARA
jgi:cysteinyl-tRNA synthetase